MNGLFLAPATDREGAYGHFDKTVLDGVPRDLFSEKTHESWGDVLHIWGITSSIRSTWENVDEGDWVLFYTHPNKYQWAAQVRRKTHNPELGGKLRNQVLDDVDENRDWDFLLFFEEPVSISIRGDEVADLLDYGNNFPVRFIRVTDERMELLVNEYGDLKNFIDSARE